MNINLVESHVRSRWRGARASSNLVRPGGIYAQLACSLVIFRAGRVIHTFTTEQMFWDWQFQDGGKQVAYSTGPTHGGAAECMLRDVVSGRTISRWRVKGGEDPPSWAQALRQ